MDYWLLAIVVFSALFLWGIGSIMPQKTNEPTDDNSKSNKILRPNSDVIPVVSSGEVNDKLEIGMINNAKYRLYHSDYSGAIIKHNGTESEWQFAVKSLGEINSILISNALMSLILGEQISLIQRKESCYDTCEGDFWCKNEISSLESNELFMAQLKSLHDSNHPLLTTFKSALHLAAHIYSRVNNKSDYLFKLISELNPDVNNTEQIYQRVKFTTGSVTIDESVLAEALYLDTETTGLEENRQIIEISLVDADLNLLFHSKVKPTIQIGEKAIKVHGINLDDLADEPTFEEISDKFFSSMDGKKIIGYNIEFDLKAIINSANARDVKVPMIKAEFMCAMTFANQLFKRERYQKLTDLCKAFNIDTCGAHSSLADAIMTAKLMRKLYLISESHSNLLMTYSNIDPVGLSLCYEGQQLRYFESEKDVGVIANGYCRLAHLVGENLHDVRNFEENCGGKVEFFVRKTGRLIPDIEQVYVFDSKN